ncbi:cytoplasmic dynein 2 heavy chain 1-like [Cyprinus carpio]|uniref:Cytoplasmic dynein 2 heavy chain 1-like n=1 Tax=Cyprinus carpio TaxID=7962 RepID=A0A9Q9VH39_CYPCA|nr:cytoplasmic dynein 2 heavy chain 1-like [Cyprinus carpio]
MNLENWLKEYFHRALDWVLKQSDFMVDTSLVGTVLNGLSHLRGVRERGQFVVRLICGLGGNLTLRCRQEFAKEVRAALIYGKCNFMPTQPCRPSLNLGAAPLD